MRTNKAMQEEEMTADKFNKIFPCEEFTVHTLVFGKEYDNKQISFKEFITKYFKKWFKKEKFNYKDFSDILAKDFPQFFDIWWYPKKFNWKYSFMLCYYLPDKFDIWWNPNKFNWFTDSSSLCLHLPDKFDIWWDPNKFGWKLASGDLYKYLPDKFAIWWDPNKFNWADTLLIQEKLIKKLPDKFDMWWDLKNFDLDIYLHDLVLFCPTKFSKWWPSNYYFPEDIKKYVYVIKKLLLKHFNKRRKKYDP